MDLKFFHFDFSKLDKTLQAFLLGTVLFMPIIFFDFYLFHKQFYKTEQLFVIIVASYGAAVGIIGACLIPSIVYLFLVQRKKLISIREMLLFAMLIAFALVLIITFFEWQLAPVKLRTMKSFVGALRHAYFYSFGTLALFRLIDMWFANVRDKKGKQLEIDFTEQ